MTRRLWRRGLATIGFAALLSLAAWASYEMAEHYALRALREATSHRMDIYAESLRSEMNRYEYLPTVLALNERVLALLEQPDDKALGLAVNSFLQTVNARAGASAVYVMDRKGSTLAASNWNSPASFIHMNFAYRPYFQDALQGGPGRFYGIGTVSREPGYYFSHPILKDGLVIGVAAVKVSLDKLDDAWEHDGEKIVVADGNGVIFLSSEPGWKYRTLSSLSDETKGRLAATRQYSEAGLLAPLALHQQRVMTDGSSLVQVSAAPTDDASAAPASDYLVHEQNVRGTDWRLLVWSETSQARTAARYSAALAALTLVLLAMLILYFKQRRRIAAQSASTRKALERVNDELEHQVRVRTEALREANQRLRTENTERKRAEEALRATLEDLVHTAKMAVLGQMSAGITHELNQPLAALRTLSGNTIVFLQRGLLNDAESNLRMIAHLTDHMGKITSQLKKFARKTAPQLRPTPVSTVISDALFLLSQSMKTQEIHIEQRCDGAEPVASCDANRLEQVLLNLLTNAVDAVAHVTEPNILIKAKQAEGWVCIEVHDNGPGISDQVAPRLFEPFFSTKEQGMGLGLGLAISADIVRHLGGTLRAEASPDLGGAMFVVHLREAVTEPPHA
jgi:two-component system C4-dicarboxylate transport sensor histidine kinase DctB